MAKWPITEYKLLDAHNNGDAVQEQWDRIEINRNTFRWRSFPMKKLLLAALLISWYDMASKSHINSGVGHNKNNITKFSQHNFLN